MLIKLENVKIIIEIDTDTVPSNYKSLKQLAYSHQFDTKLELSSIKENVLDKSAFLYYDESVKETCIK